MLSLDSFLLERGRRGRTRFFSLSRQCHVDGGDTKWLPAADACDWRRAVSADGKRFRYEYWITSSIPSRQATTGDS